MKISGLKFKTILIFISIVLFSVDVFLIIKYGFDKQLLVLLYLTIGIIPLCSIVALASGMSIPTVIINNDSKTIKFYFIANELYKRDKNLKNQMGTIPFDEIIGCEIDKNKLIIKLKYDSIKMLYLSSFSEKQINNIKNAIDSICSLK